MKWGHFVQYVQDTLSTMVDVVLPPHVHTRRTQARRATNIPLIVASHHLLGSDIITILNYQTPAVKDLIRSLKYDGSRYAAQLCATLLADFLREEITDLRSFSPRPVLLIPLPLHHTRNKERGFNQIEIVLRRLPHEFGDGTFSRIDTHLLVRTRATKQQAKLTREARIQNMLDAFCATDTVVLSQSHVFLIDDVTTTGATLTSAETALKATGAQVSLIALARA